MEEVKQPDALHLAAQLDPVHSASTPLMDLHRKAAAELRRLHQVDLAHEEWISKTEWAQKTAQPSELGRHRADVIKQRFDLLLAENKQLKATQYGSGRLQALRDQRVKLLALLRIIREKHGCGALTLPRADVERIDAAIANAGDAA